MSGAVLWSAMAGGIRAVARMSLRAPRQHGGNVVIAHARPSLRAVASFPQARGGVVAVAGSADAPGPAVRAAAAVGAIARRDAAASTSTGRIAHLAAGIAPRFRSLRCTAPARTALNASSGDDDERVNLDLSDDPFEHVALPVDEAAFDAAVDDIIADDDADAPASTSSAWSYSAPGDDLPWDAAGAWPEFDALLGKLMAKGYRIEPEGAVASTVDASVSTPEWARAVAKSYDRESDGESDGESDEEDDELSDPFAHVAKQKGEWDTDNDDDLVELSYANKKRLLLEFSRDREDLLRRLSERELYVLADHPLRKDQGNAGGRKVVNAMKRLRARLGVDASYFAGQCAALGGGDTMGECTFSDVTRLLHVFADDVAPQFRPDRAAMQSLLRRISALADTEKLPESTEPTTTSTTPAAKEPRWMERRSRRPPAREYEEDRYVRPGAAAAGAVGRGRGRGRGGRGFESRGGRRGFDNRRRGSYGVDSRKERYYDDDDGYRPRGRMERDDGYGGYGAGRDRANRFRDANGFYDDGWDARRSRGGRGGRGFESPRGRGRGRGDRPGMGDRDVDYGRRARTKGGFGSDLDGLDLENDGGVGDNFGGDRFGDRYGTRGDSFRGERGRAYERYGPREQERRGRAAMGRGGRGGGGRGRSGRFGGFDNRERGFDSREERGGWDSRGYDRGASGSGERDRNRVRMWKPKDSFGEEY